MSEAGNDPADGISGAESVGGPLSERLDRLVSAVEGLVTEVEGLGARLDRLESGRPKKSKSTSTRGGRRAKPSESVEIVMRPVTELAMAAVAERALRKADAVESVTRAEASGDGDHAARFRVEVRPGVDLVGEVGKTMPVPFRATESQVEPGVLLFDLNW